MNRRDFLKGVFGLAATALIPIKASAKAAKVATTRIKSWLVGRELVAGERLFFGQFVYAGEDGKIYASKADHPAKPIGIALTNCERYGTATVMIQGTIGGNS